MSEDMGEVFVVNLFLFLRVLLVGGIFIIFPRITRRGLFFGVYVGEEFPGSRAAKGILKTWNKSCLAWMAAALGTECQRYQNPGRLGGDLRTPDAVSCI